MTSFLLLHEGMSIRDLIWLELASISWCVINCLRNIPVETTKVNLLGYSLILIFSRMPKVYLRSSK